MRFFFNNIILWMKNGKIRKLDFKPNKVNIITGGSETGKSAILAIIDYCFFADRDIKITEEFINENVAWYGINFCINNKTYTLARKSLDSSRPSKEYYFSLIGEIPEKPFFSISEVELKKIINEEFSINENIVVPYGGKTIKAGSKISIRYFMLFNSQDENTIDSSDTFFNRQTDMKYKEALERTFDLAVGISDEKDILIKEKINNLYKELNRYNRKQAAIDKKVNEFTNEKSSLVKKAKEMGLISDDILDVDDGMKAITDLIDGKLPFGEVKSSKILDELDQKEKKLKREIKIIKDFLEQVNNYKDINSNNLDSLKPIKYLSDNFGELINHPSVIEVIDGLQNNYSNILKNISKITKNNYGMDEELKSLNKELKIIRNEIEKCSKEKENKNILDKYIFIGEAKTKINLYYSDMPEINFKEKIEGLEKSINKLESIIENNNEKKVAVIKAIEISAKNLMEQCKNAMETYANYIPILNYKEKKLELMNPKIAKISRVVGSSSNYVFLHLFFILALHEVIIAQKIKYIPSYIILDQPSRPYYDNENDDFKDKEKITVAMQLLNDYIDLIVNEYKEEFQLIVFEHIPKEIWSEMDNFYLVEEFINENKLIRKCDIKK
ncbi:DUF3732 domain-containing protein [Clostridium perfringens]|uniref:DUF3732 domain-containing protein n=3 Tax=Clostridium perfringens TaxID=1502 RepID=UPI001CCAEA85|nr:DUF3732 domain-containing protein [Clostridium perfringens]UBK86950.1 DUF3732 domain-containing protein [Clostridium perfringens]